MSWNLRFLDGRAVATPLDWQKRRAEIRRLFEKYDLGTFPPRPKQWAAKRKE